MLVLKVEIPKAALAKVTREEKVFFVSLGFLVNQLNILNKLLLVAIQPVEVGEVEQRGRNAQMGFFLRLLAGFTKESYVFLQKRYYSTSLSKQYNELLTPKGLEELKRFTTYFSSDNLLHTIRCEYAFHSPAEHLESAIEDDDLPLELYLGEGRGSCLYSASEALAMWALIEKSGNGDHQAGMDRLFEEALAISQNFLNFADQFILAFANRVGFDSSEVSMESIEIEGVPNVRSLDLPYLIEVEGT